jgi:SAM-dependent methyltransferase
MTADKKQVCTLCRAESSFYALSREMVYLRCRNCLSVFMAPWFHPGPHKEKARYETHNNDINDAGYREFVRPVVNEVLGKFSIKSRGLDFGAGTGPVVSGLLGEKGFHVELYDPFFWNDKQKLETKYDYIVCCEVMEHFHNPEKEFRLLRSLLEPGGSLICMTDLFKEETDFGKWRYKDDETHVFFYHMKSLEWIRGEYSFFSLRLTGRVIHFETGW